MSIATPQSTRRFTADAVHSSFGFAVRHMGVSTFRGSFAEVDAALVDRRRRHRLAGRDRPGRVDLHPQPGRVPRPRAGRGVPRRRRPSADHVPRRRPRAGRERRGGRRRRADDRRRDPPRAGVRRLVGARRGPVRRRPRRARAGDHDRPPRLRHDAGTCRCRRAATRSPPRSASSSTSSSSRRSERHADPGDLRQPAPGLPQHRPAPGGGLRAAARGGAGAVGGPARRAAVRRGPRARAHAARGRLAAQGDRRRRRGADRHARVQPLGPRPAQDRARLGLAPVRGRTSCAAARRP